MRIRLRSEGQMFQVELEMPGVPHQGDSVVIDHLAYVVTKVEWTPGYPDIDAYVVLT